MHRLDFENDVRAELELSEASHLALIDGDAVFRGIWEGLLLVWQALEYWEARKGSNSREVVQYRQIRADHVEELRAHMRRRNAAGGGRRLFNREDQT